VRRNCDKIHGKFKLNVNVLFIEKTNKGTLPVTGT